MGLGKKFYDSLKLPGLILAIFASIAGILGWLNPPSSPVIVVKPNWTVTPPILPQPETEEETEFISDTLVSLEQDTMKMDIPNEVRESPSPLNRTGHLEIINLYKAPICVEISEINLKIKLSYKEERRITLPSKDFKIYAYDRFNNQSDTTILIQSDSTTSLTLISKYGIGIGKVVFSMEKPNTEWVLALKNEYGEEFTYQMRMDYNNGMVFEKRLREGRYQYKCIPKNNSDYNITGEFIVLEGTNQQISLGGKGGG